MRVLFFPHVRYSGDWELNLILWKLNIRIGHSQQAIWWNYKPLFSRSRHQVQENSPTNTLRLWGWFDDSDQIDASYDPPHNAPCPYCFSPIVSSNVRTISLMWAGPHYAKRSYFYRAHRTCCEEAGDADNMDGRIFDAIARAGD